MIKLIYDECNPTRDRRPTTAEDVENDIHVEEFDSIPEVIEALNVDYMEIADDYEIDPDDEMAVLDTVIDILSDSGDGSYNILYLSIDGKEYYNGSYDGMETLDLETANEEDIIEAILAANEYEDDYDYDEDEEDMDESWYKGIDDEGDTDFVEKKVENYSDDYINEKYENLIGKRIRIINMDDPYASERYAGKEGVIENVATDPWGDVYYDGTWGSLSIYPNIDTIEFIDEEVAEELKIVSGKDKDLNEIATLLEKELVKSDSKVKVQVWGDMFSVSIHADVNKAEEFIKKFVEQVTKGTLSVNIGKKSSGNFSVLTCKLVKVQTQTQKNDTPKQTNTNINQNKQQTNQQKQEPQKQMLVNSLTEESHDYTIDDYLEDLAQDSVDNDNCIEDYDTFKEICREENFPNVTKADFVIYKRLCHKIKNKDNELDEDLFQQTKQSYADRAWKMNQVISGLNDETAYYDTEWLYIWPDGETYEDCLEDFGDEDSFKELEDTFISVYKYNSAEEDGCDPEDAEYNFHRDGLYEVPHDVVEFAHEYDKKLGLEPIKVFRNGKLVDESVNEDIDYDTWLLSGSGGPYDDDYRDSPNLDECSLSKIDMDNNSIFMQIKFPKIVLEDWVYDELKSELDYDDELNDELEAAYSECIPDASQLANFILQTMNSKTGVKWDCIDYEYDNESDETIFGISVYPYIEEDNINDWLKLLGVSENELLDNATVVDEDADEDKGRDYYHFIYNAYCKVPKNYFNFYHSVIEKIDSEICSKIDECFNDILKHWPSDTKIQNLTSKDIHEEDPSEISKFELEYDLDVTFSYGEDSYKDE